MNTYNELIFGDFLKLSKESENKIFGPKYFWEGAW
jgi:hypothetical protein